MLCINVRGHKHDLVVHDQWYCTLQRIAMLMQTDTQAPIRAKIRSTGRVVYVPKHAINYFYEIGE